MAAHRWLGLLAHSRQAWTAPAGSVHRWPACRSRTNADDRLPLDPLNRVEGGDGIVDGRDVADVCSQPSVPHPLDDLTQLGTIGFDNEVDRQAVGGTRLGGSNDRYQGSSGSNQAGGPLADVPPDNIHHQIDSVNL